MSNSLDPDQSKHSFEPDLDPNVGKGYRQTTRLLLTGKELTYKPMVLFVGHRQTVQTQIRCSRMQHLIRVSDATECSI